MIDGEVVALDERGRASFERLQPRFRGAADGARRDDIPVVFYAFDALSAEGHDLRGVPLAARKAILARFAPRLGFVRFADHVVGEGEALFETARAHELEGIVAKRADSRYESGRRIRELAEDQGAALGRARDRRLHARQGLARVARLAAARAGASSGTLVYAGAVGSGFDTSDTRLAARETRRLRADEARLSTTRRACRRARCS